MKRLLSVALVMVLLLAILPCSALAANTTEQTNVIRYEDGSYVEVSIETSSARIANTVSGTKKYTFYDSDGNMEWQAKLNATFAYSGAWYTCTTATCSVTIYDSQWYEISKSTARGTNNAYAYLTMGRKVLGVTIERPEYTIKLTCDSNGNLS